ncbi:hypothetical protein KC19_VG209400 [Ceratodon purpureus]|uniref:Pentatricopeptide repeat-containing protein n=1 Tax=Ceratodon purpureus TaxID=3225 RepID=A0A8T0HS93_CERPU|nr:hypothetical protein KC19_VG209400 [Ceratodon purpureus]
MAMAALSCIRSPLGSDRTTGLNEKSSRSSDRNEEKGGRRLEIVAFSERNPKPCVTPLRSWGSRSAFAIVQAALKPEETGSEPSRVSSRVSYKSPRRVAIRRGKGWVNMPEPGSEQAPPVLSPGATDLMRTLMTQRSPQDVWNALDALPRGIDTWEDVMETVAELRRKRNWQSVILVFEWILQGSMFKPDVGCFNMLMDAYGKNKQWTEAEKTFYLMKKFQCVPTVTSFNVLMAAYSRGGRLDKAEDLFHEMKDTNYTPGLVTYNTYLEVLGKSGSWQQAEDVFQDMQKRGVLPAVNTFTIMINIYGKAYYPDKAEHLFQSMRKALCPPSLYTYTALINAHAREGNCVRAEEIFAELQAMGFKPDVYTYNALLEAYSRGGHPAGAKEVFETMTQAGVRADYVSYNILIDAFGRAGLTTGTNLIF